MSSIALALFVLGMLPIILIRPEFGILLFNWISLMNPHELVWGPASGLPFAFVVGAVTFFAWLFSKENKKLPMTPLVVLMLIFVAWCSVTTIFAYNTHDAPRIWTQYIKIMAITFLTIMMMQDRRRLTLLVIVFTVSLGYFGVKGGLFTIRSGGGDKVYGPGGMIGDNNALAVALLMVMPFVRYLQLQVSQRWQRWGIFGCLGLILISILGSYSRGAFLGLACSAMVLALKSRHKVGFGILVAAVLAAGLAFMPDKFSNRMETIETYEEDQSAYYRLNSWHFAMNFAAAHPLGGGFDVSSVQSLWHYAPDPSRVQVAHSIYFEVLGSQGFPGLFVFLAIIVLAFRTAGTIVKRTRNRPDLVWLRDLGAMGQVSVVAFSTGGAFLSIPFHDVFWDVVAIIVVAREIMVRELAKPAPQAVPTRTGAVSPFGRRQTGPLMPEPQVAPGSALQGSGRPFRQRSSRFRPI